MAKDVITRFKLESTQYDSKIKNAAKELSDVAKAAKSAGSDFERFTKDQLAAARALGTIATSSTNAKDKAKELVGAFNDVARSYNQLTDAQKKSDFGKAVADSLTTLQQRIRETKQEMQSIGSKSGGLFGGDKLSGMLQVMGGNLMTKGVTLAAGAVTSMANEIGDAVKQGVELAKQGEGIRIAFERLGRGDILQGLREATHGTVTDLELMKAAVKFNDFKLPVEELGTMLAFAQQKAKDTGQSVDYMVDSIVTGLGRKSLMILDNLGLSATEIKERMKETGDMTKAVGAIIRDQMQKAGDYVETAADRAAQANVSLQNKMEELGRKFGPVEEASNQLWTSMKIGILDVIGGPLARLLNGLTEAGRINNSMQKHGGNDRVSGQVQRYRVAKANGSSYMANYIDQQNLKSYDDEINRLQSTIAAYGKGRDAVEKGNIARLNEELQGVRNLRAEYIKMRNEADRPSAINSPTTTTTTTTKSTKTTKTEQTELQQNQTKINALTQEYVKLSKESTEAARERQVEIQKEIARLQQLNGLLALRTEQAQGRLLPVDMSQTTGLARDGLLGNPFASDNARKSLGLQLDDKAMSAVTKQIDSNVKKLIKGGEQAHQAWSLAAQAVSSVGDAFNSIEDPGVKAMGTITQAIASIALGFAQASVTAGMLGPFGWIAWLAAGTAALATTISTVKSLTNFSTGGIVPGGAFSGDNIKANGGSIGLNSGELVLNQAQAGIIANALQDRDFAFGASLQPYVEGERIFLGLESTLKRKGKGEIVTTNTLRRLGLI